MKRLIMILALGAFTFTYAQEKETKTEVETTVEAKVETSKGAETAKKVITKTAKQSIGLNASAEGETNQAAVRGPIKVDTNTTYSYDEKDFTLKNQSDSEAFVIVQKKDGMQKEIGYLRPVGGEGYYILQIGDKTRYGTFNAEGTFVIRTIE